MKAFSESYDSDPYDGLDEAFFKLEPPSEQRKAYIEAGADAVCPKTKVNGIATFLK